MLLLPFWTTWIQHGRDLKPRELGNLNMLFKTSTVRILFRFNKNKRNCIDINVVFKWNASISRGTEIYFFMTSLPASKMYLFWYISFHLLHPILYPECFTSVSLCGLLNLKIVRSNRQSFEFVNTPYGALILECLITTVFAANNPVIYDEVCSFILTNETRRNWI